MADNVSQRSFKQLHKGTAPAQMRKKATDAMRQAEEEEFPARVKISDPLDYEKELLKVKDEIKRFPNAKLLKLVLYPVDDISVESEIRLLRTERSTVPPGAYQQAENLFTKKCIALYTSHWHRLKYNYARYAAGGNPLLSSTTRKDLQTLKFEIDEVEEEARKRALDIAAQRERVQGKRGFLQKGPFPGEGSFGQKWKRRWCVLQHGTLDGNFYLEMYRDEKGVTPLKIVNLGTCMDVAKNPKTKQFGFDLLTGDEKLVYPLAADSEEDLEEWMEALSKALGIEDEAVAGAAQFGGTWNRSDTLRDPHRTTLHSEHLKHEDSTDKQNAESRKEKRHRLFAVYPGLIGQKSDEGLDMEEAPVPGEHLGKRRVLVKCKSLRLKLTVQNSARQLTHVEPFFVSLALYDAGKGLKISEDFHVDLNDFHLRSLLEKQNVKSLNANNSGSTQQVGASGVEPKDQWPTLAQQVLFSVTFPHPDIYMVARIEKVLQSSISACAEPYIKMGDNTKAAQKLSKQAASLCSTLGEYKMPFAWAARPVFQPDGAVDTTSEFSPLYRQDRERLTDDDLLKVLSDFKNVGRMKLVTIPGALDVMVQSYDEPRTGVLNPSLVKVRPFSSGGSAVAGENLIREAQEFVPVEAFHPHTNYYIHLTYTHHLYLYPLSLKYDAQRNFAKARNIVCCIQVKEKDDPNAQPLPVIYGTALGPAFQDRAFTAVLHHCTTPSFYSEVKIALPVNIHKKHHILFTFHHVSCELQKASKKETVSSVVGYSWLPLLDKDGRLVTEAQSLSVAAGLREGYLACGPTRAGTSHLPFVDGGKPLFRLDVRANSTVYPKEKCLHQFFEVSGKLTGDEKVPTRVIEDVIEGMYSVTLPSLVAHLPVIFDQLLALLVELGREQEAIKPQIMKLLLHYLRDLEEAKRTEVVQSYVQYMFQTCVNTDSQRTLHDELAKQLALYLKQQDSSSISLLLDHMWLFFEMILKSVAQFLKEVGKLDKLSSRKKCPYSEDLYWNLQTVIFNIHTCIRMKLEEGKRANKSVATFVRRCFTVMDRGQVFKMMAKYLETFKVRDNKLLFEMKVEFLRIVCDCEHFVPLNLPWAEVKDVTQSEMDLSEEYCERHFPLGVLLREVDSALQFEPVAQRRLAIRMLCNLVAKLDLDERYTDPAQKAIISALFLPLLTIALENVHRFNLGHPQQQATLSRSMKAESVYSSPTPQHTLNKRVSMSQRLSTFPIQPAITPEKEHEMHDGNTSNPQGTGSRSSMINVVGAANRASKRPPAMLPINEVTSPQIPASTSGSQLKEITASTLGGGVSPGATLVASMTAADLALQEWDRLSPEETKDLLSCVVFVLKNSREDVLLNWWRKCLGSLSGIPPIIWEKYIYPEVLSFFDLLCCCLHVFDYKGRLSITSEAQNRPSAHGMHKITSEQSLKSPGSASILTSGGGGTKKKSEGAQKKTIVMVPESPEGFDGVDLPVMTEERVQVVVSATASCAMEVSLVVLDILDFFGDSFREELEMEHGDNILMRKYFLLMMTLLQTNQSVEMLQHVFAFIRAYIHKFPDTLYKGSSEFCSLLCYEVLLCCNSRLPAVRSEAATVLYLILKKNWEFFRGQGLVRSHVQSTIAVSVLVSQIREKSDNNLRRSLNVISNFPAQPDIVRSPEFSHEVNELMKRLRTVLTSSAQMKEYHNDPERLADLYYDLAQSYASSPELRKTWLSNLLQLHVSHGNFSEAAMCCLHMAGLVAEYLKLRGQHSTGCTAFSRITPNISKEESGIKQDIETGEEDQCYTKHDLVDELQNALDYLWQASRYEVMGEVGKLLLPFYEEERGYQLMSAMFNKLHLAYDKVVDVMATRRRYLGMYFKVAFFGKPFKGDDGVQYVYKESRVTRLKEFLPLLQTLYGKRFGPDNLVIIESSTKVDVDQLDAEKAHIQIIHVEPYFSSEEETERRTQFEHENNVCSFVYDTAFTKDGSAKAVTTTQCTRKTVVTTENWFPFVKKRSRVIHEQSYELTPIQVGIEVIENKTRQLSAEVDHSPPDLKALHLLLLGSICAQVHQGVLAYADAFLTEGEVGRQPVKEVLLLKEAYREFMLACKDAVELSRRLVSSDLLLTQEDFEEKFVNMQSTLGPLIGDEAMDGIGASMSRSPVRELSLTPQRWSVASGNPHRLSSVVFNAISNSNVV